MRSFLFSAALLLSLGAHAANPQVEFKTSLGAFTVELNEKAAPKTVANFLGYVKSGQYSNTLFHRVIPSFMVQGGGHALDYSEKPTKAPIVNESNNGLSNLAGTIAMARKGDPNSATAQFFINVKDNLQLDYSGTPDAPMFGYTVFGKVIKGMETIDAIRNTPTGSGGPFPSDAPLTQVVIKSAAVVTAKAK
jgi:peptidyl-prolyl cis-trans isomerase A (cyclophilin A)